MRDGWTDVAIADLVEWSDERLGSGPEPTILTCTENMGLIPQARKFKKRIAADDTSDYKVVRTGDLVYNPYLLWKGAIAQSAYREACITSPVYGVLRPVAGTVPGYVGLVLTSPPLIRAYDAVSIGSIERRRRAITPSLMATRLELPPIAAQRRIVDLIGAVDALIETTRNVTSGAGSSAAAFDSVLAALAARADTVLLGEVANVVGGLTKDAKRDLQPDLVEVPYLRVANVQRASIDLSDLAMIRASKAKAVALRLQPGDVLFNEGGDRDKLGRGWVWEGQVEFCIHQNHVLRARLTTDAFDPYFVSIWANGAFGQRWFEENGSQTTNLASVSLSTLRRFPIPALPIDQQREIVDLRLALRDVRAEAARALARTADLRAAVLSDLLSGNHAIPDSYNRFLVGAA